MNSFQHDLRYLIQGMVVTLVVFGAIATLGGALYILMILMLASRGSLFQALIIPRLEVWLILGAMIQIPVWITLTRVRFVSRSLGWAIIGAMVLILLFTTISSFFIPN